MDNFKIVIVEDEKPAARLLERKLNTLGFEIQHKLSSVEDALEWFEANTNPDLIFLDIQLSDGLSFEIFEQLNIKSAIIFTTAYDEYALRAFKLNSIDYLLKPIQDAELKQAIDKFREQRSTFFDFSEQLSFFKAFMKGEQKEYKERFAIKVGLQIKICSTTEIVCFYSENKATYLKTKDDRNYILDYTLEELDNILEPKLFYRINRKYIISIKHIKDIVAYSNSRLRINLISSDLDDVIVSREKVNEFKNWIEN